MTRHLFTVNAIEQNVMLKFDEFLDATSVDIFEAVL